MRTRCWGRNSRFIWWLVSKCCNIFITQADKFLQNQEITCFEACRCLCVSCKQSGGLGGIEQQRAALQITAQDDCLTGLCQLYWQTNRNQPFPFSEDSVFLKGDNKCKAVQSLAGGNVKSISYHLHNIISSALLIRLEEAVGTCVPWRGPGAGPKVHAAPSWALPPGDWHLSWHISSPQDYRPRKLAPHSHWFFHEKKGSGQSNACLHYLFLASQRNWNSSNSELCA